MKHTQIILIILTLTMLALSACVPTQPTSNFPTEEEPEESFINELLPIEVNYEDVRKQVRLIGTEFVRTPADEFGDESTFNKIPSSTSFRVATQVTLTYSAPEQYVGIDIPIIIIDERYDEAVYSGTMVEGTQEYLVLLEADHAGYSPRFKVCFGGDTICEQYRTQQISNKLSTNLNEIQFHFGRDITEKSVIVQNDGNTYVTLFTALSQGDEYELFTDTTSKTLAPGEETTITISTTGTKKGGKAYANLYALGDSCSISEECGATARLKNEIIIEYNS